MCIHAREVDLGSALTTASLALLVVFSLLAAFDGVYLHLWRYRLHARAESLREHGLHTLRSVLFPGILATLFLSPPRGGVLWLGIGLVVVDQAAELWDSLSERDSRASLGGLSSLEYALHLVLTTVRVAAITLVLASVPADGWALGASAAAAHPALAQTLVEGLLPGAIGIAALHVWLGCRSAAPGGCLWARLRLT